MKVNGDHLRVAAQQASELARSRRAELDRAGEEEASGAAREAEGNERSGERVRISPAAVLAGRVAAALGSRPALRTELVEQLRTQVTNGEYRPDPARIAAGIIDTITGRRA